MKVILTLLLCKPAASQVALPNLINSWPTATKGLLFALLALFILIGLIIAVSEILKSSKIKKERVDASWKAFLSFSEKAGLNLNERTLLKRVADYSRINPPEDIFSQCWAFEKGVSEEISRCSEDPVLLKNVCDSISGLRKKLGFDHVGPGAQYCSSRELSAGQDLNLYLPENPMIKYRSVVQLVNELDFIVKRPELNEGTPAFRQGMGSMGLMVSLYNPGDAEYSFKTKILREMPEKKSLVLEHSMSMDRRQLRDYVRLEVRNQTKFRFVKSSDKELMKGGSRFSGTIVDISGGGCNLQASAQEKVMGSLTARWNLVHVRLVHAQLLVMRVLLKCRRQ